MMKKTQIFTCICNVCHDLGYEDGEYYHISFMAHSELVFGSRLISNSFGLCPFCSSLLLSLMPPSLPPFPSRHPFHQFKEDSDD